MYNKMGDVISMQYGGSVAHHASMGKKGLGLNEIFTSVQRHWNNLVIDPSKQRVLNLFLGIYNPLNHKIPLFKIQDDAELHQIENKVVKLPQIRGSRWWVSYVKDFERNLVSELKADLTDILNRNPDSDSDDIELLEILEKRESLFESSENDRYNLSKDGLF